MGRPAWIAVAFAAGIAVGIMATRMAIDAPAGDVSKAIDTQAKSGGPPPDAASLAPAAEAVAPAARGAEANARKPVDAINAILITESAPESEAVNWGVAAEPIDAGEVFNDVIARPSQPGFQNQLGDTHRALEREARDDGWSYSMEAEIQNSMINEVSTGAFRAEHVECRATMCEVRLSGKGVDQAAAVKHWTENVAGQSFRQQLFLTHGSTIGSNERVDALFIFRRPPRKS